MPEASATLLASFEDVADAGALTRKILHSVLLPSAMETMDGRAASQLMGKANYLLAFSLEGVGEAVSRQVAQIGDMAKKEGELDTKVLKGEEDRTFWIRARDLALAGGGG